jgi:hypothetical protein
VAPWTMAIIFYAVVWGSRHGGTGTVGARRMVVTIAKMSISQMAKMKEQPLTFADWWQGRRAFSRMMAVFLAVLSAQLSHRGRILTLQLALARNQDGEPNPGDGFPQFAVLIALKLCSSP